MNCVQGDLAVIVKEFVGCESNIGSFVKVLDQDMADGDEWRIVCEYKRLAAREDATMRIFTARVNEELWISDSFLRPIRSDGITKEEVRELYEPQKQGKQVHLAAPNGPQGPVQAPQETA